MAKSESVQDKEVAKVWVFKSGSSSGTLHETRQHTDLTTSCNCKGWSQHVYAGGERHCKHTRMVDDGVADSACQSLHDYTKTNSRIKQAFEASITKARDTLGSGKRRMSFQ